VISTDERFSSRDSSALLAEPTRRVPTTVREKVPCPVAWASARSDGRMNNTAEPGRILEGSRHLPPAQRDPALFDGDRQSNRIAHEARNEGGCGTVEDVVRRAHLFEAPRD